MHDRAGVIRGVEVVDLVIAVLEEVVLHAIDDVVVVDDDVVVPVSSGLFMPESLKI